MSQLRSNAEKTPQRQHEDLHDEAQRNPDGQEATLRTENNKQNVFDSESRSDLSFTVQKDTEVIHREVKGRTKINGSLKENQSEFSETRRLKAWAENHSEFATRRGAT